MKVKNKIIQEIGKVFLSLYQSYLNDISLGKNSYENSIGDFLYKYKDEREILNNWNDLIGFNCFNFCKEYQEKYGSNEDLQEIIQLLDSYDILSGWGYGESLPNTYGNHLLTHPALYNFVLKNNVFI